VGKEKKQRARGSNTLRGQKPAPEGALTEDGIKPGQGKGVERKEKEGLGTGGKDEWFVRAFSKGDIRSIGGKEQKSEGGAGMLRVREGK